MNTARVTKDGVYVSMKEFGEIPKNRLRVKAEKVLGSNTAFHSYHMDVSKDGSGSDPDFRKIFIRPDQRDSW